jgi:predicted acyl esterase
MTHFATAAHADMRDVPLAQTIADQTRHGDVLIERDVEIPTRFGFNLYADVFQPSGATGALPASVAWTPYGKHDPAPLAKIYPTSGVRAEWMSDLTIFEAPDPVFWTSHGYAVVTIDRVGIDRTPGQCYQQR